MIQHLVEEPHRAAVHHVRKHDVISRLKQREKDSRDGRHAGGKTDRGRGIFERAQRFFQR